mgnify:CR=1 FL=1
MDTVRLRSLLAPYVCGNRNGHRMAAVTGMVWWVNKERKSDGEGMSVADRGDLGGRRMFE